MPSEENTQGGRFSGLIDDYVQFVKDHKLGGGLLSILAFFGLLAATGKAPTFGAFVSQVIAFFFHFLREGVDWVLNVPPGQERQAIATILRRTRVWVVWVFIPALIVIPVLGVLCGIFVTKWIAFANAIWMATVYPLFGFACALAVKIVGKTAEKIGQVFGKQPSGKSIAGTIAEYGVRMGQAGIILALTQFLLWGFGDLMSTLATLSSSTRGISWVALTLRAFGTLGICLLLYTIPTKLRRMNVIYNIGLFVVVLLTPIMMIASGPIASAWGYNTMSAWGDVNKDLRRDAADLSVLSRALEDKYQVVSPRGDTMWYFPGLPHSDGYEGDVNGDGLFDWSDVEYLRRNIKEDGPPPVKPRQKWTSLPIGNPTDTVVALAVKSDTTEEAPIEEASPEEDVWGLGDEQDDQTSFGSSQAYASSGPFAQPEPQRPYIPPVVIQPPREAPSVQNLQILAVHPEPEVLGYFEAGDTIVIRLEGLTQTGSSGEMFRTPLGNPHGWGEQIGLCDWLAYGEIYLALPEPSLRRPLRRVRLSWVYLSAGSCEGLEVWGAVFIAPSSGEYGIGFSDKPGTYGDNRGQFTVTVERGRADTSG